ncbi:MAG: hypothetical protein PHY72_02915 [Candidatus Pacebacteria bacterium]|nr:hypothetical protein [Candidatus Paceibacterota bacterium]
MPYDDLLKKLEEANKKKQEDENPPFLEIASFLATLCLSLFHLIPWMCTWTF